MRLIICFVAGLCAACTILTSETPLDLAKASRAPRGTAYALPKGVVDLTLSVVPANAQFTLLIDPPRYIPDPAHQYYLRYRPHPGYNDDVNVETTQAGFLSKINSTTKDETLGIIINLAQAIGAFETGDAPVASEPLLKLAIDPLDPNERKQAIRAVNFAVSKYIDKAVLGCGYFDGSAGSPSKASQDVLQKRKNDAQRELAKLAARQTINETRLKEAVNKAGKETQASTGAGFDCDAVDASKLPETAKACALLKDKSEIEKAIATPTKDVTEAGALLKTITDQRSAQKESCGHFAALKKNKPSANIEVESMRDHQPVIGWASTVSVRAGSVPEADCSIGVCYRPREPYRIVYSLGGGDETMIAELPNRSDVVAIDIRRAFFIQKVQDMTFENGFLTSLHIHKQSELLEISKVPVEVVKAISVGIQARATLTTEEKNLVQSQATLLKEKAKLNEARRTYESAPTRPGLEAAPVTPPARRPTAGAASPPIVP